MPGTAPLREAPLRVAVTGTQGQVARALAERGPGHGAHILLLGRPQLDLAHGPSIEAALAAARPDVVVNAAAYTAVDKAEGEEALALEVNGRGAGLVASAARSLGVPVVQLSTDYVFDGRLDRPYRESDPTGPVGAYGRSKLAGEQAVAQANPDHAILRTAWVYSPFGTNFVRTMLRLGETRDEIAVVADQHGSPTSALDIADGVLRTARNLVARPEDAGLRGVFHMVAEGEANWAEFAKAVFREAERHGGPSARVRPIPTAEYPTPARRPANSRLDCTKLAERHGVRLPPWQASLPGVVAHLIAPTP